MNTSRSKIDQFFLGNWYPVISFLLVIFGYASGLEVYTVLINAVLVAVAIVKTASMKPMLFYMLTFMYQFSAQHLPMKPYYSDHYYTGYNAYVIVITGVILVLSVLVYIFKSKMLKFVSWKKITLLLPLILFCGAMLANGLFVDGDDLMDFVWGAGQVLVYLVIYLFCYLGLRHENRKELFDYFRHVVILMSWVIVFESLWFILSGNQSFSEVVSSRSLALGVGNCNIVGAHAAMLIPANLYGFMKGKRPYLSIITAFAVYAVALVSTSRNAMLFGTVYFIVCFLFCTFFGARKKQMGRIIVVMAAFLAVFAVIFREEITSVVQLYLDRGMGNNGRYPLWERAFEAFLESPIFGKGFYTLGLTTPNSFDKLSFELVPDFAHNTVFELLGATGIVGFVAYSVYRISTLVIAFKKATPERVALVVSALYIAVASLLDNFVFQIFSPVFYTVTMVMAVLLYEEDMCLDRGAKPAFSRTEILE